MADVKTNHKTYPTPSQVNHHSNIDIASYKELYRQSIDNPDEFWGGVAQRIDWITPFETVKNTSFDGDIAIKWFEDGTLNACYNCLDRHLGDRGDRTAFIVERDEKGAPQTISYRAAFKETCRLANALKECGVKKGDRVTIYMPMIPQAVYAMLACARIGAVHSVVFGGFSPESLKTRIHDCDSTLVITANQAVRGGKTIPLKDNVDQAVQDCPAVRAVLVYHHTDAKTEMKAGRDIWWHDIVDRQDVACPCEEMNAEDPLFILYTSGSTGKPKGVLHTTGGYLVYASYTHELTFDWRGDDDVYWCTADVGWITGHSYIVYGPMSNGATQVIFEGVPNYPDWGRFWDIIETHKVHIFYTAPTAIRSLLKQGDEYVKQYDLSSLRVLGTVGEPINVEAWEWYYHTIGGERCPIVDTWWQTETGGHMLTPLPGVTALKPGSAAKPFFGVQPVIVDNNGTVLEGECEGNLCIADSWPGQMRTVYKNHDRFKETYFSAFPGKYFTGDGARRDKDGYYWITGRVDDVINVSGHRFGTAEIESAINQHPAIAESAVVGFPHDIKGQGIYAYIILKDGESVTENLDREIIKTVRDIIGPIAILDHLHYVEALPKTRSGKIMRRILRKIAARDTDNLGDISTLANPECVKDIIETQ